jgi:hypothetical protein
MGALTLEERRRVFLVRQEARREGLARLSAPVAAPESHPLRRRRHAVLKAAMIVALLGTGWVAYHVVEFHIPASIAEALPRL